MAPFGYSLWLWFRSNPAAQAVAAVSVLYVTFRIWLARKIGRVRKEAADEAREEVIEAIEKDTDDAIQRVEDDRAAVERLNADQLRKLAEASPHNRGRLRRTETD